MLRLLSVVTLCAVLAAQDKVSPNRFVPKDSLVVARIGAPAAWKQQFGKTLVAKLFDGATLAPLMAQASKSLEAGLEEAKKEGKIAPELIDGLMKDYAGEIVFALQVDMADLQAAISEQRPPGMSLVISLSPDGKYDLAALAEGLQKLTEGENAELRDLTVGDHKLRFQPFEPGEPQVSLPTMIDGHFVVLVATDLEKSAAKLLAADDRFEGGTSGAPFYMHVELEAAITGILAAAAVAMEEQAAVMPFDPVALFRDLIGLDCLKTLDLSVTAEGEHVMVEMSLQAKEGERGLMGMMMVDQGPPKLLRFVPPSAEEYSCIAFDLGAVYRTIAKVWTDLGDEVPMTFAAAEAAFAESTKVRLKEDLIDHLGTELLSLSDSAAQFAAMAAADNADEPDPAAMFSGSCMALALRDGKAFGESLEKALRSRGLHAARKTEEYQGQKVHRLRIAAVFEIEYAVTDEMLVLALGSGDSGPQQLRAILDARASGATSAPESVMKRLAGLREGWNGVGVSPIASILSGMGAMTKKLVDQGQLPEEAAMAFGVLGGIATDLKQLGIADMFGATYATKNGLTSRLRW